MDARGHVQAGAMCLSVSRVLQVEPGEEGRVVSMGGRLVTEEARTVVRGPGNPVQLLSPGSEMISFASAGVQAGVRPGVGMAWREGRMV